MASFFASPPFVSQPIARTNYFSSSQPPTPQPSNAGLPPQPQNPAQLSANSAEPPSPPSVATSKVAEQRPSKPRTSAESTDWIASTLTRRFGIGAGLAWVGFLAVGVVSEQIKTRLEVSQQEASTRYSTYIYVSIECIIK